MYLLEEIGVEIAMIASVVVAVLCLAYLTQLSVREQVYLWRLRRERALGESSASPQKNGSAETAQRERGAVTREKHV